MLAIVSLSFLTNLRTLNLILNPPITNPSVQLYRTANWIKTNTPTDAVFALSDAGIVGYFSDLTVINTDGLINSFDTQKAIVNAQFCERLIEWNVTYFISILPATNQPRYQELVILLPPWARTTQITLDETQEIFRSKETGEFNVAVWQYLPEMCNNLK